MIHQHWTGAKVKMDEERKNKDEIVLFTIHPRFDMYISFKYTH